MRSIGRIIILALFLPVMTALAADPFANFTNVTAGHYQVFAQSGLEIGSQVNGFMNEMLKHYSRYFSNWSIKDGARVVVFDNIDDFRAYSRGAVGVTHMAVAGYCHLKTDEDGNTFYELVTYESERLWQVLAHEGFHQFIGYELGTQVPVWLNEGMAQFFENSTVKNSRLVPGIDKTKLTLAQRLIVSRRMPAIGDLMAMDRNEFYSAPEISYPMSWALVYYLMMRDGGNFGSSQFRRYLQDLKYSRDSAASFQKRFGRDSAQWQKDFANYVLELRVPVDK